MAPRTTLAPATECGSLEAEWLSERTVPDLDVTSLEGATVEELALYVDALPFTHR